MVTITLDLVKAKVVPVPILPGVRGKVRVRVGTQRVNVYQKGCESELLS